MPFTEPSFDFSEGRGVYLHSFGPLHIDKFFYIVRRRGAGAGFFSNLNCVIGELTIAELLGMVPAVDFQHFPTPYHEAEPVNGTTNDWEYYFQPVSSFSLAEIYQSAHVAVSAGFHLQEAFLERPTGRCLLPGQTGIYPSTQGEYRRFCSKWIQPRGEIVEDVDRFAVQFLGHRVLGVHFRGTDMNVTVGHRFGPTLRQAEAIIDRVLDELRADRLFLMSDDANSISQFRKRYGNRLLYTGAFRSSGKAKLNGLSQRPLHQYLLGREVLVDLLILARCHGLVCSPSNIGLHAARISDTFEKAVVIENGRNTSSRWLAGHAYGIRKRLPYRLGGLPGWTREYIDTAQEDSELFYFEPAPPAPLEVAVGWLKRRLGNT